MDSRNQLLQVFQKTKVFANEILLLNKISKPKLKTTSIPNRRAIDEKECIDLLIFIDIVRATSYNNKYSFDFQVYKYVVLLSKGIYLQLAKVKLELLKDIRFKQIFFTELQITLN